MATVYILENIRKETYVGYTTNLTRRLRQHNGELKGGARYTHRGRPWRLRMYITCANKHDAMSLEHKIKKATNRTSLRKNETPLERRLRVVRAIEREQGDMWNATFVSQLLN